MLLPNIFYSEVVHYQGELDWPPLVCPQAWDQLALVVPMFVESFFKELVG